MQPYLLMVMLRLRIFDSRFKGEDPVPGGENHLYHKNLVTGELKLVDDWSSTSSIQVDMKPQYLQMAIL